MRGWPEQIQIIDKQCWEHRGLLSSCLHLGSPKTKLEMSRKLTIYGHSHFGLKNKKKIKKREIKNNI